MLIIKTDTDNAAFDEEGLTAESVRILRKIADDIEAEGFSGPKVTHDFEHYQTIRDINGNDVGRWKLDRKGTTS